jgi:hypothetical protein
MSWTVWFFQEVETAADTAFRRLCRDVYTPVYLWYLPGTDVHGGLAASPEAPGEQWVLAENECIPCGYTVEQMRRWIQDRAGRLPILGP